MWLRGAEAERALLVLSPTLRDHSQIVGEIASLDCRIEATIAAQFATELPTLPFVPVGALISQRTI